MILGLPAAIAALISAALIVGLRPFLLRYALASPNARSSHRQPTPQGGGIAVIAATTIAVAAAAVFTPASLVDPFRLGVVFASAIALAFVGVTDDIRPIEALPRLLLQAIAVLVVLAMLPPGLQIFSILPWWLERPLMFLAMIWFVNLVNFMDGIDWIMVVEVVPITATLAFFGLMGALPQYAMLVSLALCGAMIGFAPFNRPVAQLFLGDVGSLPIGLLLGWLLVLLADGHVVAALLLPLYFVADTTITLLRRFANGEQVTQAHRSHFYQRALDGGLSVYAIVGRVFLVNIGLSALAAATLFTSSRLLHVIALAAGCILVGLLLVRFARAKR
jgi:UDP-N-acetylmuramyl pentapeptide phosphotransferase/UDP-N-acetylglucosamine-1-phosphate transferase